MKKILLLVMLMTLWSLQLSLQAQCVVKNVIVRVNSSSPSTVIPNACNVDFDFIFTIENNGGNKYIYLHAWMANEYPNYFGCPNPSNNSKPPVAADLILSRINLGIHNEIHAGHPAPTLISNYFPDPSVVLTSAGQLIRSVYPTGDSARFTIKNVKITVPKACTDVIAMKADFWSSQAQAAQNAQCVFCNSDFTIDPRVNGLLNCILPHTFNVVIASTAPEPIAGYYEVFLDNPSDPANSGSIGTYGPEDNQLVYTSIYTTQINNGVNQYVAVNIPYAPYNNQKPDADKNLWVVVTTNQYANKTINILSNNCAPLPLQQIDFKLNFMGNTVMLNWNVSGEEAVKGYMIERKYNNETFKEIGFVEAYSNTVQNNSYSFTDRAFIANALMQYRIRIVNNDDSYSYSNLLSIRTGASGLGITVYPNPSKGVFKVVVPVNAGVYDLILTDNNGRQIRSFMNLRSQTDVNGNLAPGVYLLKINIRETGEVITHKLIIL